LLQKTTSIYIKQKLLKTKTKNLKTNPHSEKFGDFF
jgi:hypothetical protein